jgi:hypothetical protein
VEEERVVRLSILHQPVHRTQDVLLRRLTDGVLLVVCEDDHILPLVPIRLVQERRHVLDVVDASSELSPLPEIVDTNQEGLSSPRAVRVLEGVVLRSTTSE